MDNSGAQPASDSAQRALLSSLTRHELGFGAPTARIGLKTVESFGCTEIAVVSQQKATFEGDNTHVTDPGLQQVQTGRA